VECTDMCVCAEVPPVAKIIQQFEPSEGKRKSYKYVERLEEKMWRVTRALLQC
jgi:hypothetical protein